MNNKSSTRSEIWTLALWMVLLQCLAYTQGELYQSVRMRTLTTFSSPMNTVCITPLSSKPKVALKIELMVIPADSNVMISAGGVNIKNKLLTPTHSLHRLTIQHVIDDDILHILKVLLDGKEVEFIQSKKYDATHSYDFHHIALSLKGTADITPCENPTEPPSTAPATTSPPPTIREEPTTTTTTVTTTPPTKITFRQHPTTPSSGVTGVSADVGDDEGLVKLRAELADDSGTQDDDIMMSNITTYEGDLRANISQAEDSVTEDEEPWWKFIYIMGTYKNIPVLILLVILFCVGLGIGSVTTILCEQYCCCQDSDSNKNSDFDGEFRHFNRTDFTRSQANATYIGTFDSSGRITKDNISHPINATGSRSPTSECYSTPYSTRDRYYNNSTADETLPLNIPLPQENQMPKDGSFNQFEKFRDTYQ